MQRSNRQRRLLTSSAAMLLSTSLTIKKTPMLGSVAQPLRAFSPPQAA